MSFYISAENFSKRPWNPDDIYGSIIICRIEKELQSEKRKVKIIFKHCWSSDKQVVISSLLPDTGPNLLVSITSGTQTILI